jgi:hypothetical protein
MDKKKMAIETRKDRKTLLGNVEKFREHMVHGFHVVYQCIGLSRQSGSFRAGNKPEFSPLPLGESHSEASIRHQIGSAVTETVTDM